MSAPCSSRSLSWILLAVWRCLRQVRESSSSMASIASLYGSMTDGLRAVKGIFGAKSSFLRYLRTVGSDTPVSRAILATLSPLARRCLIMLMVGMSIIPF